MGRAASVVVALVFATACATPAPGPTPLPADDPRPGALIAAWIDGTRDRRSLRCRVRLALDGRDGGVRVRAKQVLVLERPARLRVEVKGFLNQTAALIVTDGERFEVFRAGDGSYDAGPVDPGLLWREAQLALTPLEVVDLLLGAPTAMRALAPAGAVWTRPDRIRMDLVDASGIVRRRATFDTQGLLRQLEVLGAGGDWLWRASFDAYSEISGAVFAHRIALDLAAGSSRAEISLRDVELNPALPADIFRLRAAATTGAP